MHDELGEIPVLGPVEVAELRIGAPDPVQRPSRRTAGIRDGGIAVGQHIREGTVFVHISPVAVERGVVDPGRGPHIEDDILHRGHVEAEEAEVGILPDRPGRLERGDVEGEILLPVDMAVPVGIAVEDGEIVEDVRPHRIVGGIDRAARPGDRGPDADAQEDRQKDPRDHRKRPPKVSL